MAEPLSSAADKGGNVTRATFLEFIRRHEEAGNDIADAQETVRSLRKVLKDLRNTVKAAGINLAAFDRARVDAGRSGEEREAEEALYLQYMAWQKKPLNFQASMDFVSEDPELTAWNTHELHAIDGEGFEVGKAGRPRQDNPYPVGSEAAQRFDVAWLRGQAEIAASMAPDSAANGERRRGRRPGSKNRSPEEKAAELEAQAQELRRRRAAAGEQVH